jgi:hypothetical protein
MSSSYHPPPHVETAPKPPFLPLPSLDKDEEDMTINNTRPFPLSTSFINCVFCFFDKKRELSEKIRVAVSKMGCLQGGDIGLVLLLSSFLLPFSFLFLLIVFFLLLFKKRIKIQNAVNLCNTCMCVLI